jgi:flagellin-like protein
MKIKNISLNKAKSRKGVSEVVSYVLLIVIAMSLAAGVYAWMNFYVPSETEEKCPDETAISVSSYQCGVIGNNPVKQLTLTIQNQGNFEVDGFFILASDAVDRPPYQPLNATVATPTEPGRFNFFPSKLAPSGESQQAVFAYPSGWQNISRVKIQPYKSSSLNITLLCPYTTEFRPEGC